MKGTPINPECSWCDDTGVMWDRQTKSPALCTHCPKGNTEEAIKNYRETMVKRTFNRAKAKVEAARPAPDLVVKWQCEICHDVHFVIKDGETVSCECQAEARKKAQEQMYLKLCRLPESRPEWTLDKFVPRPGCKEMLTAARDVVSGRDILGQQALWLFLTSPSGYGKTHIAVGICREFLKKGLSARYIYVPDLILELKQGFDEVGMQSYQSKMNFFKSVKLLAIDDLGTESSTPWVREQLDTIIDHRYVNKLPLIITTNKPLDELMPRVVSRVKRALVEGFGKIIAPTGGAWDEYAKRKNN